MIGIDVKPFEFPKVSAMVSPYLAYREALLKQYPEKMDASRIGAMIAFRMRLAGYTRQDAANEMYRKARPLRKETESR
ncbi:MAG: hypothetical protein LBM00_11375 [Deltaproteobacteria bacterium]|nr:hypothetical protein [Deltaproteobacteria bacterium]